MNDEFKESFPGLSVETDLSQLPILKVKEVLNIQKGRSRIGLVLNVDAQSFYKAYPDYDSSKKTYRPRTTDFVFYMEKDSDFYYMKNIYDTIFPWSIASNKQLISLSICSDIENVGNVSRIFTIDSMLSTID